MNVHCLLLCCVQIPFFPIVKKDLTFIHLGNDSLVDGLVNFEKLRMMAKEIRHVCHMASQYYVSCYALEINLTLKLLVS